MRRLGLSFAVVALAWAAFGQQHETEMAQPGDGNWGASWEPSKRPERPALTGVPWFQRLIDEAKPGDVLRPKPGRYSGPVLMTKPLTIEGPDVIIDGGGQGTVFVLETSGATLRGLTFTGSGNSHSTDDACLNVRGSNNTVDGNHFQDCLFGIDLKQSNKNVISRNDITSKKVPLGIRGDAIRLWYSMNNTIEENAIADSRDLVVWYSNGNTLRKNTSVRSRYSLHFMSSGHNVVEDNRFYENSVGIYVMYTDGIEIRRNVVARSLGATGMGIGFKEASDSILEGNTVIYCGVGISSDLSPYQPDSTIEIRDNRIAYNGVGLSMVGDKTGTTIENNVFEANLDQVSQSGGGSAMHSVWKNNYWDDYQGFDQNRDETGDTPYELYAYTDQIWMETPSARFFKNAPLMEALDFLERLAPFSNPELLVKDESPRFSKPNREALK